MLLCCLSFRFAMRLPPGKRRRFHRHVRFLRARTWLRSLWRKGRPNLMRNKLHLCQNQFYQPNCPVMVRSLGQQNLASNLIKSKTSTCYHLIKRPHVWACFLHTTWAPFFLRLTSKPWKGMKSFSVTADSKPTWTWAELTAWRGQCKRTSACAVMLTLAWCRVGHVNMS